MIKMVILQVLIYKVDSSEYIFFIVLINLCYLKKKYPYFFPRINQSVWSLNFYILIY